MSSGGEDIGIASAMNCEIGNNDKLGYLPVEMIIVSKRL